MMMENIFDLSTDELKAVANELQERIEEGLCADNQEILAIPTHVTPKLDIAEERVLALDWGGTNFRAAVVEYKGDKATVLEQVKHPLSKVETKGFDQERLFDTFATYIGELKTLDSRVTKIGFCFSYPAASRLNGDAVLLRWTKGLDIPDMVGKPVGKPLVDYLNNNKNIRTAFTDIKVINDTVACLFSGLTEVKPDGNPYDSYIGLILGTGTNMACLMPLDKIAKLNNKSPERIPVNMESGNFNPSCLTAVDDLVDAVSNNKGSQRFEKAVSGGYLGQVFRMTFPREKIKAGFDGGDLSHIVNHPSEYKPEYVAAANWIFGRSAKLAAASLAGITQVLVRQGESVKDICLSADGSVFWCNDYRRQVEAQLKDLLPQGVKLTILDKERMQDPNLIGSAIAALS